MADAPGENDSDANAPPPSQNQQPDHNAGGGNSHPLPPPLAMPQIAAPLWGVVQPQSDLFVLAHLMGCPTCSNYLEHIGDSRWPTSQQFCDAAQALSTDWAKTSIYHPYIQHEGMRVLTSDREQSAKRTADLRREYEGRIGHLTRQRDELSHDNERMMLESASDRAEAARLRRERDDARARLEDLEDSSDDEEGARRASGRNYAADSARERAEDEARKAKEEAADANDLARQWHDHAMDLQKRLDEHKCPSGSGSQTTTQTKTVPSGTDVGARTAPSGLAASIHAPTGDQGSPNASAGMLLDESEFPAMQVTSATPASSRAPATVRPPPYGATSTAVGSGASSLPPTLSTRAMGFAGGVSKKRKRSGGEASPSKKASPSNAVGSPTKLLTPLGRSGSAWGRLLGLPGENTPDKCEHLLRDVYNPLRQQVIDELKDRKARRERMDRFMWRYLHVSEREDPRLSWLRSPQNIPSGMRRNDKGQVHPGDFYAWDWLREVVPGLRGLEQTSAVADAIDPQNWGPEDPHQSQGQRNVPFEWKGRIDANALRTHLKETCHVTLSFLEARIREYVLRALHEAQQRRDRHNLPSMAASTMPPLNLRTELSGTPPPPPPTRPVGMEQFIPTGAPLDYGTAATPASTPDAHAAGVVPLTGGAQDIVPSTTTSSVVEASLLDPSTEDVDMSSRDDDPDQASGNPPTV